MPIQYEPLPYSLRKADELNVKLRPAVNNHKKLSIWKNDVYICDIGSKNHIDFPTMVEMEKEEIYEKGYAFNKRREYKKRHKYDRGDVAFWTNRILW